MPDCKDHSIRTVIISDLHLGLVAGTDVARRAAVRARLVDLVAGADRLVLLGDVFELRERSLADCLGLARELFEDLARVLGGGEIVLVPGNHDHALVAPIADSVGGRANLRSLEHRLQPARGTALGRLAHDLAPARLVLAYPGLWIDQGVYATHGHYMDAHSPVPMVECLAIALSARWRGGPPRHGSTPADYERVLQPVYETSRRIGRRQAKEQGAAGDISIRLYQRLTRNTADPEHGRKAGRGNSGSGPTRSAPVSAGASAGPAARGTRSHRPSATELGDRLLRAVVPRAVGGLNLLGLGPFDADVSGRALRRAGLRAMAEVVERLDIPADHVIFGHTHRPGPLPGDLDEWTIPARGSRPPVRLMNTGSWVYDRLFLAARPSDSPYWPGRCVIVETGRPPELLHPLADAGHDQLARAG